MKILATSSSDQDRLKRVYELGEQMEQLLLDNDISHVELYNCKLYPPIPEIGVIDIRVEGDWKHDLLRSEWLIKENFKILKSGRVSLEDTGADWGPELQTYYVYME